MIAEYYDNLAESYEELYGEEQLVKYFSVARRISSAFRGRLLDAGCGTLLLWEFAQRAGLSEQIEYYVGADLSEKMLLKGLERSISSWKADVVRASISALPFRPACFDSSFALTVLLGSHIEEQVANAVKRLAEVSREVVISVVEEASIERSFLERIKCDYWRVGRELFYRIETSTLT